MDRRRLAVAALAVGITAGCSAGTTTTAEVPTTSVTSPTPSATTPTPVDTKALWAGVTHVPDPFPPAQMKYLDASRDSNYDDLTDEAMIEKGQIACRFYRGADSPPDFMDDEPDDPPAAASDHEVALFFLDNDEVDEAAVKYLCPKLLDELAWANAGFTEGDTEVGGKYGIKPGRYHAEGPVSDCYWERVSGGGKTIANDFIRYAPKGVTVTVRASDGGINTQGCGSWLPVSRPGS